jgi:gamma-glutamyltranspeptidase/glutathione hydrolase
VLNIVEFSMQPQEAVEEARFQSKHFYNSFGYHEFTPGQLSLENRIPRATGDRLAQMGHKVMWEEPWSNTSAPTVILKAKDGVLMGGADPRRSRFVFGR